MPCRVIGGVAQGYLKCCPGLQDLQPRLSGGVAQRYLRCSAELDEILFRDMSSFAGLDEAVHGYRTRATGGADQGVAQSYSRCSSGILEVLFRVT